MGEGPEHLGLRGGSVWAPPRADPGSELSDAELWPVGLSVMFFKILFHHLESEDNISTLLICTPEMRDIIKTNLENHTGFNRFQC